MTAIQMRAAVLLFLAIGLGMSQGLTSEAQPSELVQAVGAVGMTVRSMDRSIAFYSDILAFEKVSDVEVGGQDYERLQGVFEGARLFRGGELRRQ